MWLCDSQPLLAWEQFHHLGDFAHLCHDPGLEVWIDVLSSNSLISTVSKFLGSPLWELPSVLIC